MIADIIEGAKPEDIPTKFMTDPSDIDLLINLDVAEKLGLTFPRDYIDSASKIVENGKLRSK
jgi:putative ABC transport system substrate-binding protein